MTQQPEQPEQPAPAITYADAGVDTAAGDRAVALMKDAVASTMTPAVVGGVGGFAGLVDVSALRDYRRPLLATSTDGVGTKVAIAQALDIHDTIGQDLVGMVVDDIVVVDDGQTTAALTLILERSKLMVEAAGAVGIAALMEKLIPDDAPDPLCIVLSGGNIDLMFMGKAVRHGLEASGRFAKFKVVVPDQPGRLVKILDKIAENGGNVVSVEHHREGFGLRFGMVEIEIAVETRDADHSARISKLLEEYLV